METEERKPKAGPELDAAVAAKVLGWELRLRGYPEPVWFAPGKIHARRLPAFSTDIAAAWPLAEQFGLIVGPTYQTRPKAPKWRACKGWQEGLQEVDVEGMTAPEAICRAVLALKGEGS